MEWLYSVHTVTCHDLARSGYHFWFSVSLAPKDETHILDTSLVKEKLNPQLEVVVGDLEEGTDQFGHDQQEHIPNSNQQHHSEKILPSLNEIPEDEESPPPTFVPKPIRDEGIPLAKYSSSLEVGHTWPTFSNNVLKFMFVTYIGHRYCFCSNQHKSTVWGKFLFLVSLSFNNPKNHHTEWG